jgi:CheY-like chemotaxis protein
MEPGETALTHSAAPHINAGGLSCRYPRVMKKVLIIEDDPVAGVIYKRYLRANNYDVDIACNGAVGLERIAQYQPDAVLLDLMMPKVNGIEVIRGIRAQESYRELPVLVMTAAAVPTMIDQAMKAGANCVFDKSNDKPLDVIQFLHDILKTRKSDASLVSMTISGNPDAVLEFWPEKIASR